MQPTMQLRTLQGRRIMPPLILSSLLLSLTHMAVPVFSAPATAELELGTGTGTGTNEKAAAINIKGETPTGIPSASDSNVMAPVVTTSPKTFTNPVNSTGPGGFADCKNKSGPNVPFCSPEPGRTLYPGKTYYISWDPSFFDSAGNTSLIVQGSYVDPSTGALSSQAFASPTMVSAWGFYAWPVDEAIMQGASAVNIRISVAALAPGTGRMRPVVGPMVLVTKQQPEQPQGVGQPKEPPSHRPAPMPAGPELYIGLPVILAFIAIMVFGTFLYNRRLRRIGLGNIMSHSRRRGQGARKSRCTAGERLGLSTSRGRQEAKESIRLMDHQEAEAEAGAEAEDDDDGYPDVSSSGGWTRRHSGDSLGSLADNSTNG